MDKFSERRLIMRATGISRPVDELGRIVIPKEIRRSFKIKDRDLLEIFIEGDSIVLKKAASMCIICNSDEQIEELNDKFICRKCITKITSMHNNGEI